MLFSSITFLFYFLPLALALYFTVPAGRKMRAKNAVLLLVSVVFYAWGEPRFVAVLAAATLAGWLFGFMIDRGRRGGKSPRLWLVLSVIALLAPLAYFKYAAFAIANLNLLPFVNTAVPNPALPLGISFYTFQLISYNIDIYRGKITVQRDLLAFAAYVSLFPQLVAGPVVRYEEVADALTSRHTTVADFAYGARRFTFGLAKKALLANVLGGFNGQFAASGTVLAAWMFALTYGLFLYFDFSGYSDMAIGLGSIFGFRLPENFNYPFISRGITEFWRRWHMTLMRWFRDYVYIPLGGNRKGARRQILAIITVWALTGLWHGAGWNYIAWGLYFGALMLIERFVLRRVLERLPSPVRFVYTAFVMLVGWVIFASEPAVLPRIAAMFSGALYDSETLYYLRACLVPLVIAAIGSTPLPRKTCNKIAQRLPGFALVAEPVAVAVALLLVTAFLADSSFNPFIYFRF